jgi:cytochrome c oxidase subunit 4
MKKFEDSVRQYTLILLCLLLLLAASYLLAHINLQKFNTPISLLIAGAKTTLVVLFFMHLKQSTRIHWIAACMGLFWLAILITLTLSDYLSRRLLKLPGSWP